MKHLSIDSLLTESLNDWSGPKATVTLSRKSGEGRASGL